MISFFMVTVFKARGERRQVQGLFYSVDEEPARSISEYVALLLCVANIEDVNFCRLSRSIPNEYGGQVTRENSSS